MFSLSCSSTVEPDQAEADEEADDAAGADADAHVGDADADADGSNETEADGSNETEADSEESEVTEESGDSKESGDSGGSVPVVLRNLTSEKRRSTKQPEKKTNVKKTDDTSVKPSVAAKLSMAAKPDFQRPELWKLADYWELVQHYRKKSEKAQQRFVLHEKELPPDHRRDPEDQAYIDSIDSVNEPAVDLAEEVIVEAAAQLQMQSQQHEQTLAETLAQIVELKKIIQDNKAVADETLKEVKAGRVVSDATYDLALNNSVKLDQCLGRPTFSAWIDQGWQAFRGKVPPEAAFFQPRTLFEWLEPQSLVMVILWIGNWADERTGGTFRRKLGIKTPGFFKVFLLSSPIKTNSGLTLTVAVAGFSFWHRCDFFVWFLSNLYFFPTLGP